MSTRLDKPQTFARMAVEVGWAEEGDPSAMFAGRALRRLCLRREDELNKQFVIRDRGGKAEKVTLGAIMKYLPELKPSRADALASQLQGVAAGLQAQQRHFAEQEAAKLMAKLEPRLLEIERQLASLGRTPATTGRRRKRRQATPTSEPSRTEQGHA